MPFFNVDVEKELGGEFWTNRYIVSFPQIADAIAQAPNIVANERQFHLNTVNFTRVRVSDWVEDNDQYKVIPINQPGLDSSGAQRLALFNVLRVDFEVAGLGRPSRKYYRLPFNELSVDGDNIAPSFITFLQPLMNAFLTGSLGITDPDGQVWSAATIYPRVAMRQLRRGSKRKTPVPNP